MHNITQLRIKTYTDIYGNILQILFFSVNICFEMHKVPVPTCTSHCQFLLFLSLFFSFFAQLHQIQVENDLTLSLFIFRKEVGEFWGNDVQLKPNTGHKYPTTWPRGWRTSLKNFFLKKFQPKFEKITHTSPKHTPIPFIRTQPECFISRKYFLLIFQVYCETHRQNIKCYQFCI